jgi:hypothetical protein
MLCPRGSYGSRAGLCHRPRRAVGPTTGSGRPLWPMTGIEGIGRVGWLAGPPCRDPAIQIFEQTSGRSKFLNLPYSCMRYLTSFTHKTSKNSGCVIIVIGLSRAWSGTIFAMEKKAERRGGMHVRLRCSVSGAGCRTESGTRYLSPGAWSPVPDTWNPVAGTCLRKPRPWGMYSLSPEGGHRAVGAGDLESGPWGA